MKRVLERLCKLASSVARFRQALVASLPVSCEALAVRLFESPWLQSEPHPEFAAWYHQSESC